MPKFGRNLWLVAVFWNQNYRQGRVMARHGSGMSQLWDPVPQSPHLGHRRATGIEQLSPCKVLMRQVSKKLGKWSEETETDS